MVDRRVAGEPLEPVLGWAEFCGLRIHIDSGVFVPRRRTEFLAFVRYLRSLHPPEVRIAIVMDNFSPHLTTKKDTRVGDWAAANNVELAYVPFYASWLNRIEAQFQALRYFALDGTDHRVDQAVGPALGVLQVFGGFPLGLDANRMSTASRVEDVTTLTSVFASPMM